MRTEPRKVIIDTDPGLDDAVGILLALNHPAFDVLAITTVAGNIGIERTTANAGRLLSAMRRGEIPYARGAARPLAGSGRDEEAIHGADGLGGVVLPEPIAPASDLGATALLSEMLNNADAGEIDILALGPLTNLAALCLADEKTFARIGRIIIMGGTINEPGNAGPNAEFNMAADPKAAQIAFGSGAEIVLIPLDVTRRLRATPDYIERLAGSGTRAGQISADLIAAYFADNAARESRPLHDPCVMLYHLAPDLFEAVPMALAVNDEGALYQTEHGAPITVAMGVEVQATLDCLADGLGQI